MNTIIKNYYMPLIKGLTLITMFILCISGAYAAGVGFVNISIVMQKAPQSISAVDRLEKEFDKKDEELLKLEDDIRKGEILLRRTARSMEKEKKGTFAK